MNAAVFDEPKSDAKSIFNLLINVAWFVFELGALPAPWLLI